MRYWLGRTVSLLERLRADGRVRGEAGWVLLNQSADFLAQFILLKVLTNGLGRDGFGEYNLADTASVALFAILLVPIYEPFIRLYHSARTDGTLRAAGSLLLRWYGATTTALILLGVLVSRRAGEALELGPLTLLAASLAFSADRWRMLGLEIRNLRRERREWAGWNIGFQVCFAAAAAIALYFSPKIASTVLFVQAAVAAVFALPNLFRFVREVRGGFNHLTSSLSVQVITFGLPFAVLLLFQWIQSFSDRYLVKAFLSAEDVGVYVAAYQVCGIPYALMTRAVHNLLTPIAYQRAGDGSDPSRLRSADSLLLTGIAIQAALGVPMIFGYAAFGSELVTLLTSEQFEVPRLAVVLLTIARFVQLLAQGLQPIFAVHRRVGRMLAFRAAGGVVSLVICGLAVQEYGLIGAAAGSAAAFVLYALGLVYGPGGAYWLIRGSHSDIARSRPYSR